MIRQYKLPTLIGLLLLIIGIGAGIFVIQQRSVPVTASPEETPSDIRITNITDTAFTVSWVTSTPTTGFVAYGKTKSLGSTSSTQDTKTSSLHHISITSLNPDTTYYFKVASNENLFGNKDEPYEAKTAKSLSTPPAPDVISGTINASAGNPAIGAIVYVSLPGLTPQSSLADSFGRWSLPLSTARNSTLSSYATYTPSTLIEIFALTAKNRFASAKIQAGSAHPVPPIIIGKTHDFGNIQPVAGNGVPRSLLDIPESQQSIQDQPSPSPTPSKVITITYPENSEQVNTQSPAFSGTGTPNLTFTIKVESEAPQTASVTVDKKGKWTWTPPSNLPPGEHKLTISWKDDKGKTQTAIHNFTVLAQGKSLDPAFTASGSAQIASPTPKPQPSATPKASASPTPKISATPSASPRVTYPSTASGVPISGSLTTTLGAIILGVVLILLGLSLPRTKVFKYY